MCGLAGFWALTAQQEDLNAIARSMANRIVHRGPDDRGEWSDYAVFSII